jgi:hypothetical protein
MGIERPRTSLQGRRRIAWLLALLFFLHAYVVASHVHPLQAPGWGSAVSSVPGEGPADCPICLADMLSGVFVLSPVPELVRLLDFAVFQPQWRQRLEQSATPHPHWQSRAPPLS